MERLSEGALARALARGRERYNALFAQERREHRLLDPEAFAAHLAHNLAPIAEAVERESPERTDAAVQALYELSLPLVAAGHLGPGSRYPDINTAWRELLPGLPAFMAERPQRLAAAVTNAVYNLGREPGARPGEWITGMAAIAPLCETLDLFLSAGMVLAWRAGMAHWRESALGRVRSLPDGLIRAALGLAPGQGAGEELIGELIANPWVKPGELGPGRKPRLRLTGRVGGFRGFGGVFTAPPAAFADGREIYLADDHACFRLFADCFGATLQRAGPMPPPGADASAGNFKLTKTGKVTSDGMAETFAPLAGFDGCAGAGPTLAVTLPRSHWVYLVARA